MKRVTKIDVSSVVSLVPKKLRVAAYCRVSTGSTEQKESLEAQKTHYENLIKANSEWEFVGIYYDEGITGTKKEKRKGLQNMITACELGQIDFIITKSISRFARNTLDCLEMVRKLIDLGVFMYFEKENLNTKSMESELILSILSSMAQDESTSISLNNKWAIKNRYKNGTFKISYPPYGYDYIGGEMVVAPEQAKVVRQIFEDTLSGKGSYTIARELNERAIQTKRGGAWTGTTVLGVIENEKYTGNVILQKTYTDSQFNRHTNNGEVEQYYIENHHAPIIRHEDFEAANEVIRQRGKEKNIEKNTSKYLNRYVMSGKIKCSECGGNFKRRTHYKKGGQYVAWTCDTHIQHKEKCKMKYVKEEDIHKAFVVLINKLQYGYKSVLVPLCNSLKNMSKEKCIKSISVLEQQVERNGERKRTMTELVGKGYLDATLFAKELSNIAAEAERLKSEKARLINSINGNVYELSELEKLLHFVSKKQKIMDFEDTLFENFVDSITIVSREKFGFHMRCGITLTERLVR